MFGDVEKRVVRRRRKASVQRTERAAMAEAELGPPAVISTSSMRSDRRIACRRGSIAAMAEVPTTWPESLPWRSTSTVQRLPTVVRLNANWWRFSAA